MAGTKLLLYKSLDLSVLLYNAETWCLKEADKCKLRVFKMSVLSRITGNTLSDRRHNESIREGLGQEVDVLEIVQQRRLTYYGHITRMDNRRLPNILLYGQLHGTRPRGRPSKRWLDNIQEDCGEMGMSITTSNRFAQNRTGWKCAVGRLERTK